jgi:hypothetical protein
MAIYCLQGQGDEAKEHPTTPLHQTLQIEVCEQQPGQGSVSHVMSDTLVRTMAAAKMWAQPDTMNAVSRASERLQHLLLSITTGTGHHAGAVQSHSTAVHGSQHVPAVYGAALWARMPPSLVTL